MSPSSNMQRRLGKYLQPNGAMGCSSSILRLFRRLSALDSDAFKCEVQAASVSVSRRSYCERSYIDARFTRCRTRGPKPYRPRVHWEDEVLSRRLPIIYRRRQRGICVSRAEGARSPNDIGSGRSLEDAARGQRRRLPWDQFSIAAKAVRGHCNGCRADHGRGHFT